jgi:hypothetical protein
MKFSLCKVTQQRDQATAPFSIASQPSPQLEVKSLRSSQTFLTSHQQLTLTIIRVTRIVPPMVAIPDWLWLSIISVLAYENGKSWLRNGPQRRQSGMNYFGDSPRTMRILHYKWSCSHHLDICRRRAKWDWCRGIFCKAEPFWVVALLWVLDRYRGAWCFILDVVIEDVYLIWKMDRRQR